MKTKRRRLLLMVLAVAVVAGFGLGAWQTGQASKVSTTAKTTAYQSTAVRQGSLSVSISGTGSVISDQTVDLGFTSSGTVATVAVLVGDQVKKGQVLATLNEIDSLTQAAKEDQVAVETAQKALDNLTANTDKNLAQALYDEASAQAAYEAAKAALRTKGQPRCEKNTTEGYYYQYLDLQNQIKPWAKALEDGNTGYGKDYLLQMLQPLWKKSYLAYTNYTYCQGFTDQEISTSQANLAVAKAKLDRATRDYATLKAASGVDTTALELAQATLKDAQFKLIAAQTKLSGATLVATIDGTVTAVNGAAGDAAGTSAFITLTDMSQPLVQVNVDETDLQNFAVGCPATVTFGSLSGQTFSGKVTQVPPTMVTVQSVSMLQGEVQLQQNKTLSGKEFPLGLTASAEITCSQADNVLLAPAQALYQPDAQTTYVYILNDQGQPEKRSVTIGLKNVALVEIRSGLKLGDRVITSQVEGK